jgi:biopolymer transport protein ExbD
MKLSGCQELRLRHQIAPLIDVVFLLLIYFMVTATIIKPEGDIAFSLPLSERVPMDVPIEAFIQITDTGAVILEGMQFGEHDRDLSALKDHVANLQRLAEMQRSRFFVTLAPDDDALHGRVVDVMSICRDAKVKHLAFADSNG